MDSTEQPTDEEHQAATRGGMSVAILAAVACVPIVIAAGFLTDRAKDASVPGDISVLALRGLLDAGSGHRPEPPSRAGY